MSDWWYQSIAWSLVCQPVPVASSSPVSVCIDLLYWCWPRDPWTFRSQWSMQQLRAGLGCTPGVALSSPLGCTDPLAAGHLHQPSVMPELTGSSHSAPPAWPCLYLTEQQQVLMRTSFRKRVVFLWGNYKIAQVMKRESCSPWTGLHLLWAAHCGKSVWAPANATWTRGAQHLQGCSVCLLSVFPVCLTKAVVKLFVAGPFLLRSRKSPAPSLCLSP